MKRLILIICCLVGIFSYSLHAKEPVKAQNGKAYLGLDISDLVGSMVMNAEAGYRIQKKWTANARISLNLGFIRRRKSSEEIEHENMNTQISNTNHKEYKGIYEETGISLRYWFNRAYNGPYVNTGCVLDKSLRADYSLGIGYMLPIWKGLFLDLMLEKRVLTKQDDITIRINYVF